MPKRAVTVAAVAALFVWAVPEASADPVPFVGCAADGQTGAVPAPASGRTPELPRAIAARLAYYRSHDLAVLAPRGWRCFSLYGSNGAILVVSPDDLGSPPLVRGFRLTGRAVVLSLSNGGTSGRFDVARAIVRLFPAHRAFALRVASEGDVTGPELLAPLAATDRIRRRGASLVDFITPAGRVGLGTEGRLAPNADSVSGALRIVPLLESSLLQLNVRLGPGHERERDAILSAFRRGWRGSLAAWR